MPPTSTQCRKNNEQENCQSERNRKTKCYKYIDIDLIETFVSLNRRLRCIFRYWPSVLLFFVFLRHCLRIYLPHLRSAITWFSPNDVTRQLIHTRQLEFEHSFGTFLNMTFGVPVGRELSCGPI